MSWVTSSFRLNKRDDILTYAIQISRVNSPTPDDEPEEQVDSKKGGRITFAEDVNQPPNPSKALYIPPPRERDQGMQAGVFLRHNSKLGLTEHRVPDCGEGDV